MTPQEIVEAIEAHNDTYPDYFYRAADAADRDAIWAAESALIVAHCMRDEHADMRELNEETSEDGDAFEGFDDPAKYYGNVDNWILESIGTDPDDNTSWNVWSVYDSDGHEGVVVYLKDGTYTVHDVDCN